MQFCVRTRVDARRRFATAGAGTSSSATATWTDERARRPPSWSASTPRPTTSGRPGAPAVSRCGTPSACPACRRCSTATACGRRYLVTYEMATRDESAPVLRELGALRALRDRHAPAPLDVAAVPSRGPGGPHLSAQPAARAAGAAARRADGRHRGAPGRAADDLPGGTQRLRRAHAADPRAAGLHGGHQRRSALQRAPQAAAWSSRARRSSRTTPTTRTCAGPGRSPILEIPITSATLPAAAQAARRRSTRACRRSPGAARSSAWGCAPVWLRPSYTPLAGHAGLRRRACAARGASCFNIIFHSSELLPGGSPYTPDAAERRPLPGRPARACSST